MLRFDEDTKTINIIAKDTGDFIVDVINYLLDDGDILYFTVNDQLEKPEPLISKKITSFTDNKALVRLTTEDTDLPIGSYYYDVEVHTPDGRIDTIMGPHRFKVLGGVRY